ncbi:hypothetical protein BH10BAC5_BH10BAC5_20840 [soil metagenome]
MDESTVGTRLLQFCNAVSPTQADFAEKLGLAPQALQRYLTGGRVPGSGTLGRLNKLGCDLNWLLNDVGSMIYEPKVHKLRSMPVPIVGDVECGVPIINQMTSDDVKQIEMYDVGGYTNPFVVIARGDSMVPYINPGDMLLCSDDPDKIKDGKAVLVNYRTPPESYASNAKLIWFTDDEIMLYSVNSKYRPVTYKKSDIYKIYKVMRIIREVK